MKKPQKSSDEANCEAAAVILGNPQKYAGLSLLWAELWMARHTEQSPANREKREEPPSVEHRTLTATTKGK